MCSSCCSDHSLGGSTAKLNRVILGGKVIKRRPLRRFRLMGTFMLNLPSLDSTTLAASLSAIRGLCDKPTSCWLRRVRQHSAIGSTCLASVYWFSDWQPGGQDANREPCKILTAPPNAYFVAILFYMTVTRAVQAPSARACWLVRIATEHFRR